MRPHRRAVKSKCRMNPHGQRHILKYSNQRSKRIRVWVVSLRRKLCACNDKPIGVGGLVRVDWRNRKAEVSFYVAEKCSDDDIKTALNMVLHYGFTTLQMWKIYFPVYAFNPRLGLYKEVMKHEYTAQKEYYYEGKHYDREVLVAYNEHI